MPEISTVPKLLTQLAVKSAQILNRKRRRSERQEKRKRENLGGGFSGCGGSKRSRWKNIILLLFFHPPPRDLNRQASLDAERSRVERGQGREERKKREKRPERHKRRSLGHTRVNKFQFTSQAGLFKERVDISLRISKVDS